MQEVFGKQIDTLADTDPEFQEIMNNFIFGDIYQESILDGKIRQLITLVVLSVNQNLSYISTHVRAALRAGLAPVEIKEAIYQCAPYIGFPKTLDALSEVNQVFIANNIQLPLKTQQTVNEDNRLMNGIEVQTQIFGDLIPKMRADASEDQKHIQDYLSAFCFGDFYTRGGLDLKIRELITLCIVSSIGGAESQVKAHVQANKNVGNQRSVIVAAISLCLPYIGFPRTLNSLACINEVLPEE